MLRTLVSRVVRKRETLPSQMPTRHGPGYLQASTSGCSLDLPASPGGSLGDTGPGITEGAPKPPSAEVPAQTLGEPHSRTAFDLSVAPLALTSTWEGNPGAPVYPCRGDLPQLPLPHWGFPPVCRLLKQITVGRPPKDRLVSHNLQGHIYPHSIPRAPWSPGGWQQAGWAI